MDHPATPATSHDANGHDRASCYGPTPADPIDLETLIKRERAALQRRRERLGTAGSREGGDGLFGIALSGGGIRSATVSLGFLEVLNRAGIFRSADYLSTVSGGGYLGGYVQAALRYHGETSQDPYSGLFSPAVQDQLMAGRHYLAPGSGLAGRFRLLCFLAAIVTSLALNLIWMVALLVFIGASVNLVWCHVPDGVGGALWSALASTTIAVLTWHFAGHRLRPALWSASVLNRLEAILLGAAALLATRPLASWAEAFPAWMGGQLSRALPTALVPRFLSQIPHTIAPWAMVGASLLAFVVVGFLANPNLLTVHVFYRSRLTKAYLAIVSSRAKHLRLKDLASADGWTFGPYPLINGCVNLLRDPRLAGDRASDHFLFSPLYCGSRLTGYRPTAKGAYAAIDLATAITASGAAVNPSMGTMTNSALALLLSILNLRLGYWARHRQDARWWPTFWPWYLLGEAIQRS
ncbi:MAG TPA: hypothetical protein VN893_17280, partial [Bryobacteraceae bacterium]|nr:hypothetical protein [Bryobacteraceae bacterium]